MFLYALIFLFGMIAGWWALFILMHWLSGSLRKHKEQLEQERRVSKGVFINQIPPLKYDPEEEWPI